MKAVRLHAFGPAENLTYEEVPTPSPAPGQVRVAVAASGVHLIDTTIRAGRQLGPFPLPELPTVPGREVAGTVEALGDGVEASWLGRRVTVHLGQAPGGYAEFAVADATALHPVPDNLSFPGAVAMIGTGRTVMGVLRDAHLAPGDTVLVLAAAGGMGSLFVQWAKHQGARVVGAAGGEAKAATVRELGADLAVDYNRPDWAARVREEYGTERPVTHLFDSTGGALARTALGLLAPGSEHPLLVRRRLRTPPLGRGSRRGAEAGTGTGTGTAGPVAGGAERTGDHRPAASGGGDSGEQEGAGGGGHDVRGEGRADPARPDLPAGRGGGCAPRTGDAGDDGQGRTGAVDAATRGATALAARRRSQRDATLAARRHSQHDGALAARRHGTRQRRTADGVRPPPPLGGEERTIHPRPPSVSVMTAKRKRWLVGVAVLCAAAAAVAVTLVLRQPDEKRRASSLTVPEGRRATQVYAAADEALAVPEGTMKKAAARAARKGILKLPDAAGGNPEGYLFPATYPLTKKTTPTFLLTYMVNTAEKRHAEARATGYDTVTVASLAQAEAETSGDMGKVARVIENRLRKNMPLQMDSTVNYALGRSAPRTTHADTRVKSPYNTYRHKGLPPTPINNPGTPALRAAAEPPAGDWLYFVTVKAGDTRFTNDYEQHKKWVEELNENQKNPDR